MNEDVIESVRIDIEAERRAFEDWARSDRRCLSIERNGDGTYRYYATRDAWGGWIGRASTKTPT